MTAEAHHAAFAKNRLPADCNAAAEAVFATLNEHTERVVSRIVQQGGGTIVEFNGTA